ncbi:MAG: hypothetical protein O3B95_08925 [Chloroflexi bacterium]|nr:hypothetical protein [Chloroflexota bacterium]
MDDCAVCHTTGRSLNEYGKAVRTAIPDGDPTSDDQRIRLFIDALVIADGFDSDGDGFSNGVEIDFGSFPGDSEDAPLPR